MVAGSFLFAGPSGPPPGIGVPTVTVLETNTQPYRAHVLLVVAGDS